MRNGHVTLGVWLAFLAGCMSGNVSISDSGVWVWLIVVALSTAVLIFGFNRVDYGMRDELERVELKRKAKASDVRK